jgi:hypothetical protein
MTISSTQTRKKIIIRVKYAARRLFLDFAPFEKLPLELQTQIWGYAIPGPRIATVKSTSIYTQVDNFSWRRELAVQYQIPALLHVCRTSRAVALKFYRLAFAEWLLHPIYFDFQRDVLSLEFCPPTIIGTLQTTRSWAELDEVRSLAVATRIFQLSTRQIYSPWTFKFEKAASVFKKLQTIYMVDRPDLGYQTEGSVGRMKRWPQLRLQETIMSDLGYEGSTNLASRWKSERDDPEWKWPEIKLIRQKEFEKGIE